ncbi:MAG: acetylxylan esterase [Bacteroidota bacterium]
MLIKKNIRIKISSKLFYSVIIISLVAFLYSCSSIKKEKSFNWGYYIDKANTDESQVPQYKLPDVLVTEEGEVVKNRLTWLQKRRSEILELYKNEIYGRVPQWNGSVEFKTTKEIPNSLNDKATMKEVTASFINKGDTVKMNVLIYLPNDGKEKHPLFVGLNFFGNHTVCPDTNITIVNGYVINKKAINVKNHKSTEAKRGVMKERWQVEKLIDKGYGLATIFYGDLDPDFDDGFQNGIHPLFYKEGQTKPKDNEWGSISAWAWGLSRAMDYFETDSTINENKIAVVGHSRLGKAALWAGAQDKRFAITISNNSGSGGAALFRRKFGETIDVSVAYAPQWYCDNFKKYVDNENKLPIDQHMLISLIVPRAVYIASAEEDTWADPKGEFLSAKYATPVYNLFNKKGIESDKMFELNQPTMNSVGYHIRSGKHDLTEYDWNNYINFADKHYFVK